MKKQIYYNIDEFGRIKKDNFSTFINNHKWALPVFFIIMVILMAWVEGNL